MVISLDIQPTGWFEQFECVWKWFQLRKNGYHWNIVGYSTYLSNFIWFEELGWFWKWCTYPDVCSLNDEIVERTCLFFEGLPSVRQNPDSKDWSQQQPLEINWEGFGKWPWERGLPCGGLPQIPWYRWCNAPHPSTVPLIFTYVFDGPMFIIVFCFFLYFSFETHLLIHVCSLSFCRTQYIHIYMHIRYHMSCWLNIVSIGRYHNFHIISLL
jgi:hypothetical protein